MKSSIPMMDFTKGNILQKMITFSFPLFLSNMLQAVYNMIDMIVVGQFIGKAGLSAVSIGGDLLTLLTFVAMGFSNAGQVIIAQSKGAGNDEQIPDIIGNLFSFFFFIALALSILSISLHTPMLYLMNTPAEAWNLTSDYMFVCSFGLIFIYGYNAVSAVLRGMGDSRHPFMFIALAAVLNVFLDLLFVAGMGMAAFGAAMATVISQGSSFLLGFLFLIRKQKLLGLTFTRDSFHPKEEILVVIIRLGFPMALKSASITVSKLFVDSRINAFGIIASGVSGIESKVNVICNLFANAVNVSCSTMIGQNIGAETYDRIPKVMQSAFGIVLTADAVLSCILLRFPQQIFHIFTTDALILTAALQIIPVLILVFLSSAFRAPFNGLINGSGNYKLNFVTGILDGLVARIGFTCLFGDVFSLGWTGYLYGDAVAGFTPFMIGLFYFLSQKWRTRKYLIRR